MSNYLYNGVELPALPDRDKEKYPYAIWISPILDANVPAYGLMFTSIRPYNDGTNVIYFDVGSSSLEHYCRIGEDVISDTVVVDNATYKGGVSADRVFWTDTDILNEDGTVYLTASDPVPVGEWQKHDAYKPNTKWNGHTFYKVIGDKWVKHDAVVPAE